MLVVMYVFINQLFLTTLCLQLLPFGMVDYRLSKHVYADHSGLGGAVFGDV